MPLNKDIKRVLVIGSGPIVIGQAAEFDYAGTQACRALKQEGLEVILINSNPATIMTDNAMADKIYIEPLTLETVKRVIKKERPDSLLSTLGGQTGLTLSMQLAKEGFLDKYNVKLLGANPETIDKAEDRQMFKMLEEDKPDYADKALEIINKYTNPDVREARLKSGLGSASYRAMMNEYYPRLRRLSIAIDYEIREVRNSEAATLIYTNPKMLNLQEMYGVAKNFRPGTKEYREVYEIAATNYPTDIVANINAASANIVYGDFDRAQQYIERVKDDPRAWNNLGVLAWLSGDSEIAKEWFTKALTIEPEKAQENLNKIK